MDSLRNRRRLVRAMEEDGSGPLTATLACSWGVAFRCGFQRARVGFFVGAAGGFLFETGLAVDDDVGRFGVTRSEAGT
jgi:hypothetical protein